MPLKKETKPNLYFFTSSLIISYNHVAVYKKMITIIMVQLL